VSQAGQWTTVFDRGGLGVVKHIHFTGLSGGHLAKLPMAADNSFPPKPS